jgi:hypothetical protein
MLNMGAMMVDIHTLLFPQNQATGQLVRMKTGLRLRQNLENRLGIMGPDFHNPVTTDYDLDRAGKLLDKLAPEKLDQLATELGRLAQRVTLEQGDPGTWEDGDDTKNVATIIALRLLSVWLQCKCIVHGSLNRAVIKDAEELEDLHYSHIRSLLRILRGEPAEFSRE